MPRICVLPLYRVGRLVVRPDIAHEFPLQIVPGREDAPGDDIAFDLGEPQFHLIEPGGLGRREVQPDRGMLAQERVAPVLSCARRDSSRITWIACVRG